MGVIWRYYFSKKSSSEHGTLYQLRNVINRSNVVKKPIDCYDATDDFFKLVIESLVITSAMEEFEMDSLQSAVSEEHAPEGENSWMLGDEQRKELLSTLIKKLMKSFFACDFHNPTAVAANSKDRVNLYAKLLLSIGLIYWEYCYAIKEGDGLRVLRCWRYMLPMFISCRRRNYAIESMQILLQVDYLLSPREAAELVWSRFVNVRGCPGRNIANDLHMEHMNRICKTYIRGLGANKTPESISRIANALGTVVPVLDNFDDDNNVPKTSGNHNIRNSEKDLKILIDVLKEASVFCDKGKRSHASCPNPRNPLHVITQTELTEWMIKHISI